MIKEHDCVVLTQDLPEEKMKAGDIGTVVHVHQGGFGYEVESLRVHSPQLAAFFGNPIPRSLLRGRLFNDLGW